VDRQALGDQPGREIAFVLVQRSRQEESIVKKVIFLSLIILSCAAGAAIASDYHVAPKSVTADDKNPGTADKPFKTINAAVAGARLKPGDTLYVHEGVYRESVELSCENACQGQPGAHIRIIAWPKEVVEIKGSDVVIDWKEYNRIAPSMATAPIGPAASKGKIYAKENWPHNTQQVFCDGTALTQIAGFVGEGYIQDSWQGRKGKGLADLEPGSFYYDRRAKRLHLWLPGGEDPAKHVVEVQARSGGIGTCDLNYYDIAGFKVTHASVGMGGSFGSYNTLENMEVTYADFCGIGVGGSFNTLIDCKSNYNGNTGISTFNCGHRILNCEVRFNNRRRWSADWHAGGMKNFSSDTVISGCVAEGNVESPGIWFDGSNTGVTIENCRCFRNSLGIVYEIGERAIIKNNVCYENTGRGIYISNSAYCAIVNNLCYRNGMSGIVVIGVEREGGTVGDEETTYTPARGNVVWGNILMDNCYPGLAIKGWENRPELIMPDVRIKSNTGNVSDYNIFYRAAKRWIPFWWNWGAMSCASLREWQEKTGNDKHSILAEPLFKDVSRYDFHPADKSPAILFARPQMSVATDCDGKRRSDSPLLTAGPFEADPKFLPGSRALAVSQVRTISFDFVKPLPKELAALSDAMTRELAIGKLPDGNTGFLLKNVPVMNGNPPIAATLDKDMRSMRMGISRNAKTMYFALGLVNPGKGPQARCRIARQDGTVVELKWEAGRNIGSSLGKWDGKLGGDGKDAKTEVGWQSRNGQARIFLVSWNNDNEWYPVKDIEWVLDDDSASLLIFGVTAK
jgi:parallel beta-helix repeat protein